MEAASIYTRRSSLVSSELRTPSGCGGVIVVGANYRALGVVRSFGRRGIPVWVLKERDELLAATSCYVQRSLKWPIGDDHEKITLLLDIATNRDVKGWLLVPTEDEGARLIAQHHEVLSEHFSLTTPPWDVLQWAYDKRLTYRLARNTGVDCPWTICPASREEVSALDCQFPAIIKPAYKTRLNRLTA